MTNTQHTPGPWAVIEDATISAPDPSGIFAEIFIAEITAFDEHNRVASPEQQEANLRLIAAAPALLEALQHAVAALTAAPRFPVRGLNTDSYAIAEACDHAIDLATKP